MPKKFEFTGSRRYDPTATTLEVTMTDDNEYWGGDTRIFIQDPHNSGNPWIPITCFRELSGGEVFTDMEDTTCYGDLHKRYMSRQFDSEPILLNISPKTNEPLDILELAFKYKARVNLAVLLSDSRYIIGPVRVERMGVATPIDGVLGYNITLRRVGMPYKGKGWYSVLFDIQPAKWENNKPPQVRPFYINSEYVTPAEVETGKVISPFPGLVFDTWEVSKRLNGELVEKEDDKGWLVTDDSLIFKPQYTRLKVMVKYVVDPLKKSSLDTPASPDAFANTFFSLQTYTQAPYSNGRILDGWDVVRGDPAAIPPEDTDIIVRSYDVTKPANFLVPPAGATICGRWVRASKITFTNPISDVEVELPPDVILKQNTSYILPPFMIDSKNRYLQTAWKCSADDEMYMEGGSYIPNDKIIKFTPVWERLYSVVYTSKGAGETGEFPKDKQRYKKGDKIIMPSAGDLTLEGKILKGWTRQGTSGDAMIKPGDTYEVIGRESSDPQIKFYPVWGV